jgi:hypothetical protein
MRLIAAIAVDLAVGLAVPNVKSRFEYRVIYIVLATAL